MKNKRQWISILIVGMALATAWAIRGQFGHEQGAAWAGAIGGLALVMISKRKDWYNKMMQVAFASAVGWGMGGMMSYGQVVGYGRADNFINVYYGLAMLFVIGALYGLTGGGLVGLVLDSTKENKVKWGHLIAEMTAGGLISYFFLVEQLGIKMTPPRSEAWAICLGIGLAMLWHMAREKRNSAIRVAIISALGGGFGFAFGNFLQTIGTAWGIHFNMWNVMEYSIGFFGGIGMAYGVYSSKWPVDEQMPDKWVNRASMIFGIAFFPLIVFWDSLSVDSFIRRIGDVPHIQGMAVFSHWFSLVIIVAMIGLIWWRSGKETYSKKDVVLAFFSMLIVYTLISFSIKGLFVGKTELNHHLYLVNILVIFFLFRKEYPAMFETLSDKVQTKNWTICLVVILMILATVALISVYVNPGIGGAHNRFTIN